MWSLVVAAILAVISASDADVPDAFRDRTPLPSCGAVLQELKGTGWDPTANSRPEIGCLAGAVRNGASAELAVVYTTFEGDKVVYWYRSEPGRPGLELFVDASGDAFAGPPWEHARCAHAVPESLLANLGGCAWD